MKMGLGMPGKLEIFRIIFLLFGGFETLTNAFYVMNINGAGLKFAAKQHFEVPLLISSRQLTLKVAMMFICGLLLLGAGISNYPGLGWGALSFLSIYQLMEAIYYRFWRAWLMAGIYLLLLIIYLFG